MLAGAGSGERGVAVPPYGSWEGRIIPEIGSVSILVAQLSLRVIASRESGILSERSPNAGIAIFSTIAAPRRDRYR